MILAPLVAMLPPRRVSGPVILQLVSVMAVRLTSLAGTARAGARNVGRLVARMALKATASALIASPTPGVQDAKIVNAMATATTASTAMVGARIASGTTTRWMIVAFHAPKVATSLATTSRHRIHTTHPSYLTMALASFAYWRGVTANTARTSAALLARLASKARGPMDRALRV